MYKLKLQVKINSIKNHSQVIKYISLIEKCLEFLVFPNFPKEKYLNSVK